MCEWLRGKLHITSWQDLVHIVVVEIVVNGLWWVVTKVFNIIPDIVKGIGFLVIFVAGMFCVAWYLPKLTPQYVGGKTKSNTNLVYRKQSRLEHDGVLWEDAGKSAWGIRVVGPLCPKDFVVLGSECRDKIVSHIKSDDLVSDSRYHSRLVCPECKSKYTLGIEPKTVKESENEVRNRFEGKRRREQET